MQARVVDVEREGDEKVVEDEMDVDDVTTRSVTTRGVTTSGVTTSDVTLDERKDVEMEECDTAMATVGSERDEEEVEKALLEIAKIDFRRWLRYTMAFGFDGRRLPGALLPHGESLVSLGKLNECAVEVTLDTGAQVTAISEEQYDRIGRPPMVEKVGAVPVGADGREMKLLGVVSPVTFRFGDYDYPFQAWVIRGLRAEVLLGQDFGKQYRIVTDSGGRDGTPQCLLVVGATGPLGLPNPATEAGEHCQVKHVEVRALWRLGEEANVRALTSHVLLEGPRGLPRDVTRRIVVLDGDFTVRVHLAYRGDHLRLHHLEITVGIHGLVHKDPGPFGAVLRVSLGTLPVSHTPGSVHTIETSLGVRATHRHEHHQLGNVTFVLEFGAGWGFPFGDLQGTGHWDGVEPFLVNVDPTHELLTLMGLRPCQPGRLVVVGEEGTVLPLDQPPVRFLQIP